MGHLLAFFGAFNPPTRAHIDLAEYVMKAAGYEGVIFVPSKSVYITESQKKEFAFSDSDRLKMLEKIAAERPWMSFTDIEMREKEQPRTYVTLCMLRDHGLTASLLIGADKLIELENKWAMVPEIASEFGIVCMDRGDVDCREVINNSPFLQSLNITVVDVPDRYKDFSSSRVRECLARIAELKSELQTLLPPELSDLSRETPKQ